VNGENLKKASYSHVSIDMHCHSDASDGMYSPQALADIMAREGIDYAVLTDHNTIAGLYLFYECAEKQGITAFSGAELHGSYDDRELHILAYGFEPESGDIHRCFSAGFNASEIIECIHNAGGLAVLAHPLNYGWSHDELSAAVRDLAKKGLDGIEAYYRAYTEEQKKKIINLADSLNLVCSGGSDFHGSHNGSEKPGIKMPVARWKVFREKLGEHARRGIPSRNTSPSGKKPETEVRINWNWFLMRIIMPSVLVMLLFIGLTFAVLIPGMEKLMLDRRKEETADLAHSAWSIVQDYYQQAESGIISHDEAKMSAVERIRHMRYGPESKDYFWITDMECRMIMHPYRIDLEGVDMSGYTDPNGVLLFEEFVRKVKEHSMGFVSYIWQWQDDPERMEAKESFVMGFEQWGWIIGTGLYVDDVKNQIDQLTKRIIDLSFIVVLVTAFLMLAVALQSLKIERRRSQAEEELRVSHERYRALVESSSTGILLLYRGRCIYANSTIQGILGYSSKEASFLDFDDIMAVDGGLPAVEALASSADSSDTVEVNLRRKNGESLPALISANTVLLSGKPVLLLSIQDITRHQARQTSMEKDRLMSRLQTSLLYLTEPVSQSMGPPVSCRLDSTIANAVNVMNRKKSGVIAVTGPDNELLGIVTDHDIRMRVVGADLDTGEPVSRIMSAPVVTVNRNTPVFEAIMLEQEKNINHLAVTDSSGRLAGIIDSSKLLRPDKYSPVVLTHRIRASGSLEELRECRSNLPALIGSLLDSGALSHNICQIASTVSDNITLRIIDMVIRELGTPPARFAVLVLGSEARKEQTLATDQDNALVYEDTDDNVVSDYFLEFGRKLCDGLDTAGYNYCRGGNMASNKRWNQPLSQWKKYYSQWIKEPDEEAIALCNVFFDQRCVYGNSALLNDIRKHIAVQKEKHPAFLSYMALNTLKYKLPLGLFGRIITGMGDENEKSMNIKEAMLPLVNFARLYSFMHGIEELNTFERLERLYNAGILQEDSYRSVRQAYSSLMQIRFAHQIKMIKEGNEADNSIDPAGLTQIQESMLKNCLSQISVIQKRVSFEFHAEN